mgnify:CR=1 FL=1
MNTLGKTLCWLEKKTNDKEAAHPEPAREMDQRETTRGICTMAIQYVQEGVQAMSQRGYDDSGNAIQITMAQEME